MGKERAMGENWDTSNGTIFNKNLTITNGKKEIYCLKTRRGTFNRSRIRRNLWKREDKCDWKDKGNQTLNHTSRKKKKKSYKSWSPLGGVGIPRLEIIETCSKRAKGDYLKDETRAAVWEVLGLQKQGLLEGKEFSYPPYRRNISYRRLPINALCPAASTEYRLWLT